MSWLARQLFPGAERDQRRRKMHLLYVIVIVGLLFAAVFVGGLYLLNNPISR